MDASTRTMTSAVQTLARGLITSLNPDRLTRFYKVFGNALSTMGRLSSSTLLDFLADKDARALIAEAAELATREGPQSDLARELDNCQPLMQCILGKPLSADHIALCAILRQQAREGPGLQMATSFLVFATYVNHFLLDQLPVKVGACMAPY